MAAEIEARSIAVPSDARLAVSDQDIRKFDRGVTSMVHMKRVPAFERRRDAVIAGTRTVVTF
jgi:hypothetical protein